MSYNPGNPFPEEFIRAQPVHPEEYPLMEELPSKPPPPQSPVQSQPIDEPHVETGHIRQIIDFSPSTIRVLEQLANGGSIGDALRDAIALSKWFNDTREKGGRILVEHNGKLREVNTIKYPPDK